MLQYLDLAQSYIYGGHFDGQFYLYTKVRVIMNTIYVPDRTTHNTTGCHAPPTPCEVCGRRRLRRGEERHCTILSQRRDPFSKGVHNGEPEWVP